MELENKIVNDLYKSSGDSFLAKNVTVTSDPLNPSTMIYRLNHVRSLAELDDSKINLLLKATDKL